MTTLADRLAGSPDPVLPADADGVCWRPAASDDIDAIHDLYRSMDPVDHPDYTTTRSEVAADFSLDHVDPARDTLLAVDDDGRVLAVGWSILPPEHDRAVSVYTTGGVRPESRGRGLGRAVLDWQIARARQQLAGVDEELPGHLQTWVDDRATSAHPLLERRGYRVARWFLALDRDLARPIADPPVDGFEVRSPREDESEALRLARNASFRDHWGSQPRTPEEWALNWTDDTSRHDLGSIALDPDGEVAAFVLAYVNPEDFAPQGFSSVYIGYVGTRAEFRRRGLAEVLLARTMRLAVAEGLQRAVLDVDAESPTGALGLYERLGFEGTQRSRAYVLEV